MKIPDHIPGYRIFLILFGLYAAIWIVLEGNLIRVSVFGVLAATLVLLTVVQRRFGGKVLTKRGWLLLCSAGGLWLGLGSVLFTMLFMAIKSGLHAHGWEYTIEETQWILRQPLFWSVGGLLFGFGVGLVVVGITDRSKSIH